MILKKKQTTKTTPLTTKYGEKTKNHEKLKIHTLGRKIWREKLKKVKNEKSTLKEQEYGKKTENHGK